MDLLNERKQKTAVTMRRSALVLYESTSSYSGSESNPKRTDDPTLCSWTPDVGSRMWQNVLECVLNQKHEVFWTWVE